MVGDVGETARCVRRAGSASRGRPAPRGIHWAEERGHRPGGEGHCPGEKETTTPTQGGYPNITYLKPGPRGHTGSDTKTTEDELCPSDLGGG